MGVLFHFFSASIAHRIEIFFTEFGLFAVACAFFAGAVAAEIYLPRLLPLRGKIIGALVVLSAFTLAYEIGFRARARFDASADYLREIERKNAELSERQREAIAANVIAENERARSARLETERNELDGRVADYVDELNRAKDACALDDGDLKRLREFQRHGAARVPPKPTARPAFLRPAGSVPDVRSRQ